MGDSAADWKCHDNDKIKKTVKDRW